MIQKNNLIKSLFIYGNLKYFSDYKDKFIKHFKKYYTGDMFSRDAAEIGYGYAKLKLGI